MSRIGVIGLSSLEVMGIKGTLVNMPEYTSITTEITVFEHYQDFQQNADKLDLFIVGLPVFVSNIEFFMPRKARTLLINPEIKPSCSEKEEKNNSGVRQIFRNATEEEISVMLRSLFSEPEVKGNVSGDLSIREKEVLTELARGKTNKEIADILSISVNTVITHRKNISVKLGIKSVSGLSLYALMNGLI